MMDCAAGWVRFGLCASGIAGAARRASSLTMGSRATVGAELNTRD